MPASSDFSLYPNGPGSVELLSGVPFAWADFMGCDKNEEMAGNAPVKGAAGTSRREAFSNFPTISPSLRGVTTSLANPRRERVPTRRR